MLAAVVLSARLCVLCDEQRMRMNGVSRRLGLLTRRQIAEERERRSDTAAMRK
jgi:hypothetical protein